MKSFMIICLYLLLDHHGSEGITSVTECPDKVNVSCRNFEMIHVERITYYNGTDCNQALTDQQVCGQPLTGSDTGLLPSCNGKTACGDILYYTCPGSKAARLDYRCVEGKKLKDMCDETVIENTNRIFLSTPNFPSQPTFTNKPPCRCYIRGSNITSIEILELVLQKSDDGTKSRLEINYGDVTYRTESLNGTSRRRRVYNKRLISTSTRAEIILNHKNINKQYVWIEIQGVSMRVSCDNRRKSTSSSPSTVISISSPSLSPTTSTSSPSTTSTSSSSSTISTSSPTTTLSSPITSQSASEETNTPKEPPFTLTSTPTTTTDSSSKTTHPPQTNEYISKNQDYTSVIAGSVVGGAILIVIIIIVIIFICRKRSQNRSSTTKPDTEKIDVNPDYISMDYQRIHRGQPDGGEIDDDLTKADDDVDLNEVIESDSSGQTASKSNKDVVYAEVNKPGRKSLDSESNSVAPNFTLGDDGLHHADVDGDVVKDSIGQAMSEDNPADETSYTEVNKPGKSLGGENELYVPFDYEDKSPERIITENELYVPFDDEDKSPERMITENELYVPFDDEASDRIVMENDLYVPMEDTLITAGL